MEALRKVHGGAGGVELAEVPPPAVRVGAVVLDVAATGVCGTDLHIEAGEYATTPPVTMGHEISGTVAAVGDGVTSEWLGVRVVCETFFDTCEQCRWCRAGRRNLCPQRRSLGSHVDGGFASQVLVPARNLHRVPEGIGSSAAALSEPLACICQALLDPSLVNAGDRVLVVGPGPMGLLAAQVARACGAHVRVVGLPSDAERLQVAADLGIEVRTEADSQFDVVIECSGSAGGAQVGLAAAARSARYVQVGVFGRDVSVDLNAVLLKELTVSSGFASTPVSWLRAMTLLADGLVRLEPLLSEARPLNQWRPAFDALRGGHGLKVVLEPTP